MKETDIEKDLPWPKKISVRLKEKTKKLMDGAIFMCRYCDAEISGAKNLATHYIKQHGKQGRKEIMDKIRKNLPI